MVSLREALTLTLYARARLDQTTKETFANIVGELWNKINDRVDGNGQSPNGSVADPTSVRDTYKGGDDTMSSVQEQRHRLLSDGCREYAHIVNHSRPAWYEMYYDDHMHYIYCLISKASCTSWKRTLMMLSGKITQFQRPEQLSVGLVHNHRNSDLYVPRLEVLPEAYRDWRFGKYFTFVFVREPLERLVSAYRDKVLEDPGYHVDVDIVRQYRPRDYNESLRRYNVTFAEFVRYVLDQRSAGKVLDRHWIPQNELCRVCRYRWEFVGHQETLHADAAYVVAKLKSRVKNDARRRRIANVTFPADSGHRKSSEFVRQMYAGIPAADIQALYELYAIDYALFGFNRPITSFT